MSSPNDEYQKAPRDGVGDARRGVRGVVNYHKVALEEAEKESQTGRAVFSERVQTYVRDV